MLHPDADTNNVSRSLEAYLVWLFGYVMFPNTHRNSVGKFLLSYARAIVDADEAHVPVFS
jgi:ABC-type sulfate transport system permease component